MTALCVVRYIFEIASKYIVYPEHQNKDFGLSACQEISHFHFFFLTFSVFCFELIWSHFSFNSVWKYGTFHILSRIVRWYEFVDKTCLFFLLTCSESMWRNTLKAWWITPPYGRRGTREVVYQNDHLSPCVPVCRGLHNLAITIWMRLATTRMSFRALTLSSSHCQDWQPCHPIVTIH